MKLSLKLEDDQNSVVKAKLPITIFNHPFISTLAAAANTVSSNPSFSLSTNFHYGPSLRVSYTPSPSSTTSTSTPFSVSLKSGLGIFGSPSNSPLVFSAHFSLSPATLVPTFSLHFKPQFGNFSLHQASFSNPNLPDHGSGFICGSNCRVENGSGSNGSSGWQEVKLEPSNCNGGADASANPRIADSSSLHKNGNNKTGIFSAIGFNARTSLPLTNRFAVSMRWNVHFPRDSWMKMPYLTMNKIGIESLEEMNNKNENENEKTESNGGDAELLTDLCFRLRGDLKVLDKENREMKRLVEEMRQRASHMKNLHSENEGYKKKASPAKIENPGESERSRGRRNVGEDKNGGREMKKNQEKVNDVESELQRAIKAKSAQ